MTPEPIIPVNCISPGHMSESSCPFLRGPMKPERALWLTPADTRWPLQRGLSLRWPLETWHHQRRQCSTSKHCGTHHLLHYASLVSGWGALCLCHCEHSATTPYHLPSAHPSLLWTHTERFIFLTCLICDGECPENPHHHVFTHELSPLSLSSLTSASIYISSVIPSCCHIITTLLTSDKAHGWMPRLTEYLSTWPSCLLAPTLLSLRSYPPDLAELQSILSLLLAHPVPSGIPGPPAARMCPHAPVLTVMISSISLGSIVPSPFTSYMAKAHSSFCSGLPADVMLMANRNSLKSILPLLSESNVLNTCSQNFSAFPWGKKLE